MTWPRAIVVVAVALALFSIMWAPAARRALDPQVASDAADFPNYYFGGERLRGGEPVYDSLESEIEEMFGVVGYDTYPADSPATVVLFTPLSLFAYDTAWMIWQAISAVLVVVSIVIVAHEVGYSAPVATAAAALAFLTTPVRFLLERNHMEGFVVVVRSGRMAPPAPGRRTTRIGVVGCGHCLEVLSRVVAGRSRRSSTPSTHGNRVGGCCSAGDRRWGLVLGLTNVERFSHRDTPGRQAVGMGHWAIIRCCPSGSALVASWFGWLLVGLAMVVLMPRYFARPSGPDRTFVLGTAMALLISPLSWFELLHPGNSRHDHPVVLPRSLGQRPPPRWVCGPGGRLIGLGTHRDGFRGGFRAHVVRADLRVDYAVRGRTREYQGDEMALDIGDRAPTGQLDDDAGQPSALGDYAGRKLVVFFYPKAMTPGCTTEACGFRDNYQQFGEAGYDIVGISPDTPEVNAAFRQHDLLPFRLLSDVEHSIADQFGAWGTKRTMGGNTKD